MLLKSIKLKDFRQFNGEQEINFSTDKTKNVTIIMGENGSGKTTFAQAFRWCLYGNTILDGVLLSKELQDKLYPGEDDYVEVAVELVHNEKEYTIKRKAKYKKNSNGQVAAVGQADFTISYKEHDGNQVIVPPLETELKMKEILPEELSGYFFFDGEHIEAMSKEINYSNKSKDIAEAVKSLLGLKAHDKALEHLKSGRGSVIGSYMESYNGAADSEIVRLSSEIGMLNDRIDEINKRLQEIDTSLDIDNEKIKELDIKIEKNSSSMELAAKRRELESKLKSLETAKAEKVNLFLKSFNSFAPKYFSTKLMQDSLQTLKDAEKLDTGIPDITASTIQFLFNKKRCICGQHIEAGDPHYDELYKLLDSIPPKSLGSLIGEFTNSCEEKTRSVEVFKEDFDDKFKFLRDYEETRAAQEHELKIISQQLDGMEDVSVLERDRASYKKNLVSLNDERDRLNQEKGEKESKAKSNEQRVHELSAGNQKNAEIDVYKSYAVYVYDKLKAYYEERETETRKELAESINEIFKTIYDGGFSLSLDDKYNIEVYPQLQTSTGQSIAIILAFIAGVIKMARERKQSDAELATTEPYPLVMDAPLSAFDKKRIVTVCDVLPKIAEQVIIFIKDTDGELAEDNLGKKIGKRYRLQMVSQIRTDLVEGAK